MREVMSPMWQAGPADDKAHFQSVPSSPHDSHKTYYGIFLGAILPPSTAAHAIGLPAQRRQNNQFAQLVVYYFEFKCFGTYTETLRPS
jgi:hypothetical protein